VLAEQGFLPATETTPAPSLALIFTWGTLYADMEYGMSPDAPPVQRNRQQILKFLGGYKLGFSDNDFDPLTQPMLGASFMNYEARDFLEAASDDYYMAIVAAYDIEAAKNKKKEQLWVTRISCPSRRYWLSEVMPTMMAIAGPNIGKETPRPVWVNASDKYKPTVKIGDLKLLDYLENGNLPVLDQTVSKKKPSVKK